MHFHEAKEFMETEFRKLIHDRFIEQWEDTFTRCSTRDPEEYKKANPSMYTYYMAIINSLSSLPETVGKYERIYGEGVDNEFLYVTDMYNDFKETDNPMIWLMTYVPISL